MYVLAFYLAEPFSEAAESIYRIPTENSWRVISARRPSHENPTDSDFPVTGKTPGKGT